MTDRPRRSPLPAVLALALATHAAAQQQVTYLPSPNYATSRGNSSTSFPFASAPAFERHQWVFDASLFTPQQTIVISEVSIRSWLNRGLDAFCFPAVSVTLASGTAPVNQLSNTDMDSNLGPDRTVVRDPVRFAGGPVPPRTSPPFVSPWVPLGLTRGFLYDPRAGMPLVIDVRVCDKTTRWSQSMEGANVASTLGRTIAANTCGSPASGSSLTGFVPVVKLDWGSQVRAWQTNSPEASLDIDGTAATEYSPARVRRSVGQLFTVHGSSTLGGRPWSLVMINAPAVGLFDGGFPTRGNQIINFNILAGGRMTTVSSLWQSPNGGSFTLNYFILDSFGPLTLQLVVLDPTHPDGFVLSGACEIVAGPAGC